MAAGEMATPPPPFSAVRVNRPLAAANRLMAAVHAVLVAAVIAHRARHLLGPAAAASRHAAMLLADLTLLLLWALSQSGLWRPVSRAAFPERLLASRPRSELPGVDVLVVTADPDKEPALGVMNTVVSAMALDYPGGRLGVYLSDDAGSPLTLLAARKAYAFARAWVPFCRRYSVRCPWPDRYFAGDDDDDGEAAAEERLRIKKVYEAFKGDIEEASKDKSISTSWTKEKRQDHDAYVEIITAGEEEEDDHHHDEEEMAPLLVYVSREKRRACPHHFKAGALNALLRVSSLVSNAPYVLVLDCDMSCNSRASALEAMCFHLDRSPPAPGSLAFVQFPQMFHNLSRNDIYTNDLRYIFATRWLGQDGLRGPTLSGTGFYVRRDALFGATPGAAAAATSPTEGEFWSMEPGELARMLGHSDELVASVHNLHHQQQSPSCETAGRRRLPQDAKLVASCSFENGTGWGDQVGFMYQSIIEDYFTGYRRFFCRGWTSAYCYPAASARPPFLGSMPTNLNDVLVQNKRWMAGMLAVGLSKCCPLTCPELLAASVPHAMSIAYFGFAALYAFPALCYATLPQLCFLRGVPLFPEPRWPAAAACASSLLQHLVEVSVAKRRLDVRAWWNEQRFWMLNAVTGQLFGCVSAFQELAGAAALDFDLTSKASDGSLYHKGVFDFTGCSTLLLPATTLSVLNAAALVGGTWKMITRGGGGGGGFLSGELFPQLFLLSYVAALSYPLLEGMFLRQDPARVPPRITALSAALAAVLLALFG